MNAIKNFEIAAEVIYNEAPTEKARVFAEKIINKIREKGEEWIIASVLNLHISATEVSDNGIATIESNRPWYVAEWQLALTK